MKLVVKDTYEYDDYDCTYEFDVPCESKEELVETIKNIAKKNHDKILKNVDKDLEEDITFWDIAKFFEAEDMFKCNNEAVIFNDNDLVGEI